MAFEKVSVNEEVIGDPELGGIFCLKIQKKFIHTLSLHYLDTNEWQNPKQIKNDKRSTIDLRQGSR